MPEKIKTFQNLAVLKCYELPDRKTVVTEACPYCRCSHIHGKPTLSHSRRVAHCTERPIIITGDNGLPLTNADGYYLNYQKSEDQNDIEN